MDKRKWHQLNGPEDNSDSDASENEETEDWQEESSNKSDLPSEYWHALKLIKYIKAGNQTATVISLACMKDEDMFSNPTLTAVRDIKGLEILINLLETKVHKCVLGSLQILSELSQNHSVQKEITDLGAIQLLVQLLKGPEPQFQSLAANTVANLAKISKARKIVRKTGGIPIMVDLLDIPKRLLITPRPNLTENEIKILSVASGSAKALCALSQCNKIKEEMRRSGCVGILGRFLLSIHEDIVAYTLGTIDECSSQKNYQHDIQSEGIIREMVHFLSSDNLQLKKHCASAIFKCAEDMTTRRLVREQGGLEPLVALVGQETCKADKCLISAATGAIWKCAMSPENVKRLDDLDVITVLVELLQVEDEEPMLRCQKQIKMDIKETPIGQKLPGIFLVLKNVAGALAECAKMNHNRLNIFQTGGIEALVSLLNMTNKDLLENVTKVLGECAKEIDCMKRIEELDGVRLIWSLLKNKSKKVQASAAWALVPCIRNSEDTGEMVRSLVGGLELIVSLLRSENQDVLASVCSAIAHIAQDTDNLAVITDHGVVPLLCNLVETSNDVLREHLALAIANCCKWNNNCFEFGRLGAVAPLVSYMGSKVKKVHRSTALALNKMSEDPFNCVTLHQSDVVPYLLVTIASSDETLQEASAGCLANIRKLALAIENLKEKI